MTLNTHNFLNKRSLATLIATAAAGLFCSATLAQEEQPTNSPPRSTSRPMVPTGPIDEQSVNDVETGRRLGAGARRLFEAKELAMPTQPTGEKAKVALAAPTGSVMSPEAIYRDRSESVVIVGTVSQKPDLRVNNASGFVISSDGVIVTNYHVAGVDKQGAVGFVVMTHDGRVWPVKQVLAKSEKYDVAILKIEATGLKPVPIADRIGVGADVFLISNPSGKFWYFSRGMVSRYAITLRKTDPVDTLQISADFARGSSGAPILSSAGEVVGMVASTNSIYYETTPEGVQKNLQMVLKSCVTSKQILELIEH
ncbi:MAG: serine protease [Tepidisphaeraceae bacterium]